MDINETIAAKLKEFMAANGLSVYRIAKETGLDHSTLNRFVKRDIYEVKFSYLHAISDFYKVPLEYFTGSAPLQQAGSEFATIAFYKDVAASAGGGVQNFVELPEYDVLPLHFFKHVKNVKDVQCICVKGNSMEPVIKNGDFIFVDVSCKEIQAERGIYVIRIEGELYVKGVQKIQGGIRLLSYNQNYPPVDITAEKTPADEISVIGRVVATFSKREFY